MPTPGQGRRATGEVIRNLGKQRDEAAHLPRRLMGEVCSLSVWHFWYQGRKEGEGARPRG